MNVRSTHLATAIATLLACSLLTACGGGGGGGMVRSSPPPATPPSPPPPAAAPVAACPTPITGDCVVTGSQVQYLPSGRQSGHALVIGNETSPGILDLLLGDDSRFDGGVAILNGTLAMSSGSVRNGVDSQTVDGTILDADVTVGERGRFFIGAGGRTHGGILKGNVANRGEFELYGTVDGSVENRGSAVLHGSVAGNVSNHGNATFSGVVKGNWSNDGRLDVGNVLNGVSPNRIDGDFRQSATGLLSILLPSQAPDWADAYSSTLSVGGRADLEGSLELRRAWFNDGGAWYGYLIAPLPTAPISIRILHAAGGVFGQFTGWNAASWLDENDAPRPLFITGSLRYGANDVWFDLARASIEAAMAGQGAGGITVASAANLDRLFARADGLALMAPASLSQAQHRLLASAGAVLRIADIDQATRTLDTLSGAMHADVLQAALRDSATHRATGQHLAAMGPGSAAGAWAKSDATGSVSGLDQWLSPRLLVGVHAGQDSDSARDTLGQSSRLSPAAGVYLRWFGDNGWYAGGSAGYAQHTLALDRTIDLSWGGRWNAHARHRFNVAGVHGEAGRRFSVGASTLTPYLALDASALRSERTIEQGRTGFELALQPAMQAQLGVGLGLRYGREWRVGETGWLRLDADARVQGRMADAGDPLRAAFAGVPDLWFDLPSNATARHGWLDVGLSGGFGRAWRWSFAHARSVGSLGAGQSWSLHVRRAF